MPRENNPRAISSEINHEKKKRRNGNNRKRENERSCGPSKNNAARSIVSSLRFFRSILLRFPIVFFFLSVPFLEFFHDECEKTTQEYNENCLGLFGSIKNHDSRLSLPPFVQHWWRRWVGARGFPWLVIQVNYDCTRKTHEEKENGRRSIFQRVFPRFSWVDITFRITCLEGMKSRALCALGALVGRFLVLIRWLITCFAYDYWIWF